MNKISRDAFIRWAEEWYSGGAGFGKQTAGAVFLQKFFPGLCDIDVQTEEDPAELWIQVQDKYVERQ